MAANRIKGIIIEISGDTTKLQTAMKGVNTDVRNALYRVENVDRYDDRLLVATNLIEAYDLLMEFVAKHTSDKFHLINNVNTSVRDMKSDCPYFRTPYLLNF